MMQMWWCVEDVEERKCGRPIDVVVVDIVVVDVVAVVVDMVVVGLDSFVVDTVVVVALIVVVVVVAAVVVAVVWYLEQEFEEHSSFLVLSVVVQIAKQPDPK